MDVKINYAVSCAYISTDGSANFVKSEHNLSLKTANAKYLEFLSTYTPNKGINQVTAWIVDCYGNIVRKETFSNLNPFVETTDTTAAA